MTDPPPPPALHVQLLPATPEHPQILRCTGELDLATAAIFRAWLDQVQPGPLTVDLRDLHFMDSSGIGALLTARRRLTGFAFTVLVAERGAVARILEIGRLNEALSVTTDSICAPRGHGN
ncbi:MAG: hypothetical protein JWM31_2741 [Solirubrobacterales bacterium]|nr:hypothetical protein [Solirubrobacterales bacterium]